MAAAVHWIEAAHTAFRRFAGKVPVLRSMMTGHWVLQIIAYLIPLLLFAALLALLWDGYERVTLGNKRVHEVEAGLQSNIPKTDSRYCKRLFGSGIEYPGCYAGERIGYQQFSRAWVQGHDLGTVREQLIACYMDGRRVEGMSWAVAAHCAEADLNAPDTGSQAGH